MVSVIIPNYNNANYLEKCVESLYKNCNMTIEIIIVDNASEDDSRQKIERFLKKYKNIYFYSLDKNYGFAYAVNYGIKKSSYEFVFLLNNDTEIEKDCIENLYEFINKDSDIFSVNTLMIRMNQKDKVDDAGDYFTIMSVAYKGCDGYDISHKFVNKKRRIFSSCAGASLYRKEIFKEIGYFDENFFAYLEDVDISYRANIYGYKNYFTQNARVYHIGSLTSGSKYNSFKIKLVGRNTVYLIYKNMPLPFLIINIPFILIGNLVKYIFYNKKGYGKDFIEGISCGIKNISDIKKTDFKIKNIFNYLKIEAFLIIDTFRYFVLRANRR